MLDRSGKERARAGAWGVHSRVVFVLVGLAATDGRRRHRNTIKRRNNKRREQGSITHDL